MARPCLDTWIFQQIWGDSTVSFSPFPQLLHTERPDRVIGNLLEGRVALLAEGSPTALILPVTFLAFYQSPDEYSFRSLQASFIRFIRLFSFGIAI